MDNPQLPASLLTTIAGAPVVDHLSFGRVRPCPYTGWWKIGARFRAIVISTGAEIHDDVSVVVGSPFIVADVVLEAINQAWREWSGADVLGQTPSPLLRASRLVYMAGMSWLPQELHARREAVKKNPRLRRVLGMAGGVATMTDDLTGVVVRDAQP